MLDRGAGSIITVASQLAVNGGRGNAAYISSKGAIIALTRTTANDYANRGVRVNSLLPGATGDQGRWRVDRWLSLGVETATATKSDEPPGIAMPGDVSPGRRRDSARSADEHGDSADGDRCEPGDWCRR